MMNIHGCPRCNGAVVQYGSSSSDGDLSINCGWRRPEIPDDVMDMVQTHLEKPYVDAGAGHTRVGRRGPPLVGWERGRRLGQQHDGARPWWADLM